MTSADSGASGAAGGPWTSGPGRGGAGRCPGEPCEDGSCGDALAADDALLDSVARGTHAVEEPVGDDLDDEVERELAAVLVTWRGSVRRQSESWSVDVDRAVVLVDRARSTPSTTRRLRAPLVAAAIATLVAVTLWSTSTPSPQDAGGVVLAASADLDQASEALERGDTTRARSALERAEERLRAADESRATRLLRERWREVHDQVDAEPSAQGATRSSERRAAGNSTTSTTTRTGADQGGPAETSATAETSSAAWRAQELQHRPDREETSRTTAPETTPETTTATDTGPPASGAPVRDAADRTEGERSEGDRSDGDRSERDRPGLDIDHVGDSAPAHASGGNSVQPGPRSDDRDRQHHCETGLHHGGPDVCERTQDRDQEDRHDAHGDEDDEDDEDDDGDDGDDEDED
jgi:hypothetical protein